MAAFDSAADPMTALAGGPREKSFDTGGGSTVSGGNGFSSHLSAAWIRFMSVRDFSEDTDNSSLSSSSSSTECNAKAADIEDFRGVGGSLSGREAALSSGSRVFVSDGGGGGGRGVQESGAAGKAMLLLLFIGGGGLGGGGGRGVQEAGAAGGAMLLLLFIRSIGGGPAGATDLRLEATLGALMGKV